MSTVSGFIEKILEIIGYEGNRKEYTECFINSCAKKAQLLSPDDYSNGLHKATKEQMRSLLRIALKNIPSEKKEELKKHLATFPQQ